MKASKLLFCVFVLLICACNNTEHDKTGSKKKDEGAVENTKSDHIKIDSNKNSATQKKLLETNSLSDDDIQNWFPKTILKLNQESTQKGTLKGIDANGASALYAGSNNQKFTISITDCAGKGGAKIYKRYARYKKPKEDHEDNTSITRHFNNDGKSGKSVFVKPLNQYAIEFLYKDRLAITIGAQNIKKEYVYQALDVFPFDELKKQ